MNTQLSNKKNIQVLIKQCIAQGLKEIVISPGSRNAPLILSFSSITEVKCYTIVDERSAAFFAMGMAKQLKRPVALLCTSGSATLNYAPAIVEAYYQEIPLVVITADRPVEWLGQADGQTISQNGVYNNYIRFQTTLPVECNHADDEWYTKRSVSEAFYKAQHPVSGPVHINVPLREPLYGLETIEDVKVKKIDFLKPKQYLSQDDLNDLKFVWKRAKKVMIIGGVFNPEERLNICLNKISYLNNTIVLTETTTNIQGNSIIKCIDRQLAVIEQKEMADYMPDLLISFGGQIVSKQIKKFLRTHPPKHHWHVSMNEEIIDTFQHMSMSIKMDPALFFVEMYEALEQTESDYGQRWQELKSMARLKHDDFVEKVKWSDLKVFDYITRVIPENYTMHTANSTPVRYAQLFQDQIGISSFANRGASGIDGSVSTALGACVATNQPTVIVTGDLSFFYDSNGFWNKYLTPLFKVILINNGGGGIFRFIPGPAETKEVGEFFEAHHEYKAESLAKTYNLGYFTCSKEDEIEEVLTDFFEYKEKAALIEIFTPGEKNGEILRSYFSFLKD